MAKPLDKIILQPSHVAAFRYIERFRKDHHFSPEIKEIAKAIKLNDRQVYRIVDDLVLLGYVSREHRKKRSIKILKQMK